MPGSLGALKVRSKLQLQSSRCLLGTWVSSDTSSPHFQRQHKVNASWVVQTERRVSKLWTRSSALPTHRDITGGFLSFPGSVCYFWKSLSFTFFSLLPYCQSFDFYHDVTVRHPHCTCVHFRAALLRAYEKATLLGGRQGSLLDGVTFLLLSFEKKDCSQAKRRWLVQPTRWQSCSHGNK